MAIPDFNLVPGRLDINAVVGDDFSLLINFGIDLTGYTFDAQVILQNVPSNTNGVFTVNNVNLSEGRISLNLTDTQTRNIGALANSKWYLTWTTGSTDRTVLSGKFTLNNKWSVGDYAPTSTPITVVIDETTVAVTVVGGAGGSVLWGDIEGDVDDQADLIAYLSTNYQPLAAFLTAISGLSSSNAGFVLRRNLANSAYEFSDKFDIGAGTSLTITPVTSATNAGIPIASKGTGSVVISDGNGNQAIIVSNSSRVLRDSAGDSSFDFQTGSLKNTLASETLNYIASGLYGPWTASSTFAATGAITGSNLSGTNTGDQYGGATASGANQYLRRNAANSAYEFAVKTDYLTATPTTGQTVSFNDTPTDQFLRIAPAGTLADLTIDLPSNTTSAPSQKVVFVCTQDITTLVVTGASSILNAPAALTAGDCMEVYKSASDEWAFVKST